MCESWLPAGALRAAGWRHKTLFYLRPSRSSLRSRSATSPSMLHWILSHRLAALRCDPLRSLDFQSLHAPLSNVVALSVSVTLDNSRSLPFEYTNTRKIPFHFVCCGLPSFQPQMTQIIIISIRRVIGSWFTLFALLMFLSCWPTILHLWELCVYFAIQP